MPYGRLGNNESAAGYEARQHPKKQEEFVVDETATLKENVEALLDEQGRRIGWLARRLGMDRMKLWRKLNGVSEITPAEVEEIAVLLDVPASILDTKLKDESDGRV